MEPTAGVRSLPLISPYSSHSKATASAIQIILFSRFINFIWYLVFLYIIPLILLKKTHFNFYMSRMLKTPILSYPSFDLSDLLNKFQGLTDSEVICIHCRQAMWLSGRHRERTRAVFIFPHFSQVLSTQKAQETHE